MGRYNEIYTVKIVSCVDTEYWYSKHIGETFKVKFFDADENDYLIQDNEYPSEGVYINCASILYDDCTLSEPITPNKHITKHTI